MDPNRKRHAFGQHFLKDTQIAGLIADTAVDAARETRCRSLLEIGPGHGAITIPLLDRLEHQPDIELLLCERDRELVPKWRERLGTMNALRPGNAKARIEEGDFLDVPEERWLGNIPVAVASNLPYSAGTAIAIRLAQHWRKIPVMVLMFQAEVARRLRAEPGTKEWGSLSIWLQNRWQVEKVVAVPPSAFRPAPKVDSEVVKLTPRAEARIPVAEEKRAEDLWNSLLRTAFAHRRKMLRSGLPSTGPWRNALDEAKVSGTSRAEELGWEDWGRLYAALLRVDSQNASKKS